MINANSTALEILDSSIHPLSKIYWLQQLLMRDTDTESYLHALTALASVYTKEGTVLLHPVQNIQQYRDATDINACSLIGHLLMVIDSTHNAVDYYDPRIEEGMTGSMYLTEDALNSAGYNVTESSNNVAKGHLILTFDTAMRIENVSDLIDTLLTHLRNDDVETAYECLDIAEEIVSEVNFEDLVYYSNPNVN